MAETCFVCGNPVLGERLVLVRGNRRHPHCSEACLHETVHQRRKAVAAALRRRTGIGALAALIVFGGATLWRYRAPSPRSISYTWPEALPEKPAPLPGLAFFGPAWPPTDEDWIFAFDAAKWTHPLPGPVRRAPNIDARIFGADAPKNLRPVCRKEGHCGVDLGGELWGEHVYAALDGVIDRVQAGDSEQRGGIYVRISHLGGMVFSQYFHLAATPKGVHRGATVRAGDVVGLLGDTGLRGEPRHLHFALSVRPSNEFPEVYWDPTRWLEGAQLRVPPRGTVAGLVPPPTAPVTAQRGSRRAP